jgi:hypothetical protein
MQGCRLTHVQNVRDVQRLEQLAAGCIIVIAKVQKPRQDLRRVCAGLLALFRGGLQPVPAHTARHAALVLQRRQTGSAHVAQRCALGSARLI